MRRILITGADSYIGTSFEKWVMQSQFAGMYEVDTLDMRGDVWKEKNFSGYDTVFHVAGIAHADIGNVTGEQKKLYYQVNCDLAVSVAKKAKCEGVKQFIYMSSIIVYGESSSIFSKRIITKETKPTPSNFYGDSKWRAEQKLSKLSDSTFCINILRPPMIFGEGCKGNYRILEKLALRTPLFPDFPNQKSVLHIHELCEYVKKMLEHRRSGLFFPQNKNYVKTADMVKQIAEAHGKKVYLVKGFNWLIYLLAVIPGKSGNMMRKAFGSLLYEKGIDIGFGSFDD